MSLPTLATDLPPFYDADQQVQPADDPNRTLSSSTDLAADQRLHGALWATESSCMMKSWC